MIAALRKAGTVMISYAVESASEKIQKLIKKNLDLDKVNETIKETVVRESSPMPFSCWDFPPRPKKNLKNPSHTDFQIPSKPESPKPNSNVTVLHGNKKGGPSKSFVFKEGRMKRILEKAYSHCEGVCGRQSYRMDPKHMDGHNKIRKLGTEERIGQHPVRSIRHLTA